MKRNALALILVLALVISAVAGIWLVKTAHPKTITVPDDYPTIQEAVGNATSGDTVFVKSGIYYGTMQDPIVIDKPLSLVGENANTVILQTKGSYYPSNAGPVIEITGHDVTISGFTIINGSYGIACNPLSSRCKISGNNIDGAGMSIVGDNHVVSGNNITGSGNGIEIVSSNTLICGNNIYGNSQVGIIIVSSSNVTIYANSITGNGHGLSEFPEISGGLSLESDGPFHVYGNNITDNLGYGIQFSTYCNNSTVHDNTINRNIIGINLQNFGFFDGLTAGLGNIVYDNNLIDNFQNAFVEHNLRYNISDIAGFLGNGTDVVSWDNGTVGNYWSDYQSKYPNATEVDTSGVGNTPYVIDGNNTDYCPFMHPVDISAEPPQSQVQETFPTAPVSVASIDFKKRKH